MLIVDGHLDLAMNALEWNRDLTQTVAQIRKSERHYKEKGRAAGTVAFPELKQGRVMLSFATLIARVAHKTNGYKGNNGQEICHAKAMGQLAYYRLFERLGHLSILADWPALERHVEAWRQADADAQPPHGVVLAMEGADPITTPDELPAWWDRGLRLIGLSHYGVSSYAHGTGTEGGLVGDARALLRAMDEIGMILDLTHLADQAFWEALESFDGPVHASHCNARALVPNQRQLNDEQIKAIVERRGVIGVAFDMWMLQPDWVHWIAFNEKTATLEAVVDHIDHMCNLAGSADHVALGTDLDGGYGIEQTPLGFDTIADLQKIPELLQRRGYTAKDIAKIMHGNWLEFLRRSWT